MTCDSTTACPRFRDILLLEPEAGRCNYVGVVRLIGATVSCPL